MGFSTRTYHQPYSVAKAGLDAIKIDEIQLMPLLNAVFSLVNARIEQSTKQKSEHSRKEKEALQGLHMSLINIQAASEKGVDEAIIINSLYQNLVSYLLLVREAQGANNDFTLAIGKLLDKLKTSEKYEIENSLDDPANFLTVRGIRTEATDMLKEEMKQRVSGIFHAFKRHSKTIPEVQVTPAKDAEEQVELDFSFQKPGLRSLMKSLLNTYRSLSTNLKTLSTAYAHTNLLTQSEIITNDYFSEARQQLAELNAAFITILSTLPNLNEQCIINRGAHEQKAMHFDLNAYRDMLVQQLSPEIAVNPEEQEALLESLQKMLSNLVKLITEVTYDENGFEGNIFAHELSDKPELKKEMTLLLDQFMALEPPLMDSSDPRYGRLMSLYNDLRRHDQTIRSAMNEKTIPSQPQANPEPEREASVSERFGRFANYVAGSLGVASAVSSGLGSLAWNMKAIGVLTRVGTQLREHTLALQTYFGQQEDIMQTVVPAVIQQFAKNFNLSAMQNAFAIYNHMVERYLTLVSKPDATLLENFVALIEMKPTANMTQSQTDEIKREAFYNFIALLHEVNQALSNLSGLFKNLAELQAYMNYDPETKKLFSPILQDIKELSTLLNESPQLLSQFGSITRNYLESKLQQENVELPNGFPNTEDYPQYMRGENPLMLLSRELGTLTTHARVIATLDIDAIVAVDEVKKPIKLTRSRASSTVSTDSQPSTSAGSEKNSPRNSAKPG